MRIVTQHQEIGAVPAGHIVSEVSPLEGLEVDIEGHEEDSIINVQIVADSVLICLTNVSPLSTLITPCTMVHFRGPWVAHLDKSLGTNCLVAEDSVGVTLDQTVLILVVVIVA